MSGWEAGEYSGPMSDPDTVVTYIDLADWAQITLVEAERRFGVPNGPERMRIAGQDYFRVRDVLHFLELTPTGGHPPMIWFGRPEVAQGVCGNH